MSFLIHQNQPGLLELRHDLLSTRALPAQPTQQLLEVMIPKRTIAHLANPMLKWMASNLVVKQDDGGRKRPVKKANASKIDGMVALIMAIGSFIRNPPKPAICYETRGIRTL